MRVGKPAEEGAEPGGNGGCADLALVRGHVFVRSVCGVERRDRLDIVAVVRVQQRARGSGQVHEPAPSNAGSLSTPSRSPPWPYNRSVGRRVGKAWLRTVKFR